MKIFKNNEGKIRSGWRIAFVLLLSFVLQVAFGAFVGMIGAVLFGFKSVLEGNSLTSEEVVGSILGENTISWFVIKILSMTAVILSVFIILSAIDKKRFRDIGLKFNKNSLKHLFIGLLMGAVSMTFIFAVISLTGNVTVEDGFNFSIYNITGLIIFILVALNEELFSRGYCLYALKEQNSEKMAIIVSSIIFALLHVFNPNLNWFGIFNIFLVGVLFAYMTLKTDNLMMAIGYHLTWNYFQGNVFGLSVSGQEAKGIITVSNLKDNIITGGAFGPEAGILTTIVLVIGFLFVYRFVKGSENNNINQANIAGNIEIKEN